MSARQPAEWNASVYHQVSNPHVVWGRTVLAGLELRGDETVIDAGCGSGRLTAELLELLPEGRVIAIDRSANMLSEARLNLANFGDRVRFLQADAGHLTLQAIGEPADLVFSTATFHWIADHPALFRGIFSILKPGGLLSAQCGGGPNLDTLLARAATLTKSSELAPYFAGWPGPWEFASDRLTAERLQAAGFVDVSTWLYEAPAQMDDADAYGRFLTNVIMGEHLNRLPPDKRAAFIEPLIEAAARDEPPFLFDYWRLNMRAIRPFGS